MTITAVEGGYTSISAQPLGRQAPAVYNGTRPQRDPSRPEGWRGHLVGVTGTGGAGASLLATGLAADLAADASNRGLVVLADLAVGRGQASRRDGSAMVACPATVATAHVGKEQELEGLVGAYRFVVADLGADAGRALDTESAGVPGDAALAQAAVRRAHLIVVVGDAGSLGLLVQATESLAGQVGAERVLPVVNRLPRSFRRRTAAAAEAVRLLASGAAFEAGDPVFITERISIRRAVRDGLAPPSSPFRPLAAEVRLRLAAAPRTTAAPAAAPLVAARRAASRPALLGEE